MRIVGSARCKKMVRQTYARTGTVKGAFKEDVPKGFGRALPKEDVAKVANPFGAAPLRAAVTQVVGIAAD